MIKIKDETGKVLFTLGDNETEPSKVEISLTETELIRIVTESKKKECSCNGCTESREE